LKIAWCKRQNELERWWRLLNFPRVKTVRSSSNFSVIESSTLVAKIALMWRQGSPILIMRNIFAKLTHFVRSSYLSLTHSVNVLSRYFTRTEALSLSQCKRILTEHLLIMLIIKENNINNSYIFTSWQSLMSKKQVCSMTINKNKSSRSFSIFLSIVIECNLILLILYIKVQQKYNKTKFWSLSF